VKIVTLFALLQHDAPAGTHWDLLAERVAGEPRLATWRLSGDPRGPESVPCERIADHRREYLDFEGDIGGGRGVVLRVDRGEIDVRPRPDGATELRFRGAVLTGAYLATTTQLVRIG
jgi:hypothetical protein